MEMWQRRAIAKFLLIAGVGIAIHYDLTALSISLAMLWYTIIKAEQN